MTQFKVGDRVKFAGCEGEVKINDRPGSHPVVVVFGVFREAFTADGRQWTWHKEPSLTLIDRPKVKRLVPHWPALIKVCGDNNYCVTTSLYADAEQALERWNKPDFIRLCKELPGIEIEVDE